MSAVAAPSPRTETEPMAFTAGEFFRGAISAWLWFLGLSSLGFVFLFFTLLPIVLLYSVPISFLALIMGLGPAFLIGRGLRRFESIKLHVTVFALYGIVVGVVSTAVTLALLSNAFVGMPML